MWMNEQNQGRSTAGPTSEDFSCAAGLASEDFRINFALSTSTQPSFPAMSGNLFNPSTMSLEGDEFLNSTPPALLLFLAGLPATVDGAIPDADTVISICLQSNIPAKQTAITPVKQLKKLGARDTLPSVPASSGTNVSVSENSQIIGGKRKSQERIENDQTIKVQSKPQVMDIFRIRQIQKARAASSKARSSSSYSTSYSGDLSSST